MAIQAIAAFPDIPVLWAHLDFLGFQVTAGLAAIQAQALAVIRALVDTVAIPVEAVILALVYQDIPEVMEQMEHLALVVFLVFQVTQVPMELMAHLVFQELADIQVSVVILDKADILALTEPMAHLVLAVSVDILAQDCQGFLALLAQALQSMQQQA